MTSTTGDPRGGRRTAWARSAGVPLRAFLETETGGAAALLAAALAALAWANVSPSSYEGFWHTELSLRLGDWTLAEDLRHWVNDGLMTFFFFVVGLEIRRELDMGELRERRRLATPVAAALGGMIVPALLYLALNAGGGGASGWGIVIATDTAFALAVLALVGGQASLRLRAFVLTLVIVDDVAALTVIGLVYMDDVSPAALAVAAVLFLVVLGLRHLRIWRAPAYAVVGVGIWVAMVESGVHPTIAGVLLGLLTTAWLPSRERVGDATELVRAFREQPTPALADEARLGVLGAISPNERLQYRLHPWTSFVIVPVFALANAGVALDGDVLARAAGSPITLGILLGLVAGKLVGIAGAAWLVTRRRLGAFPLAVPFPSLVGAAAVAGIGFTVSLFIADLTFEGERLEEAKLGILGASILASLLGLLLFRALARLPERWLERLSALEAPPLEDLAVPVDPRRDHVRGPLDAPVTLVEYGDFQCPFCGQAEDVVRELLSASGAELRYVFRHLPLADVHPHAPLAAEAAEAAAAQGRFWEMQDLLYARQDRLEPPALERYAAELGLDVARFAEELRERRHRARILDDVDSADASGVAGTPTFFVNGRRHHGAYDLETLTALVRAAAAASRRA
ncbi:MAG TPA: Na+/H+ antiporter NhaA [Gaiellaceae bacterium]|nr:Na+/H+ antiporter NhaA [Gaiellaceae bacterium]